MYKRLTCYAGEVNHSFRVSRREVEVLGYLLEYQHMPHEEQLAVQNRRWRILRLQRVRGIDKGLSTQVDGLLSNVVKDRRLRNFR